VLTPKEKFIVLLNNDLLKPANAIILLEGDGDSRVEKTVELYKNDFAKTVVFSGGIYKPETGCIPSEFILPLLIKKGINNKDIILENKSQNTREQAVEVIDLAIEKNWRSIILVASHYHQFRAFLTFLQVLKEKKCEMIIYNAPASNLSWFSETCWGERANLLDLEFEKIEKYALKGHIASYEHAIGYMKWKEKIITKNMKN
jgi:uncharacterized SAM-binding protein YcdF (DUF218 family)